MAVKRPPIWDTLPPETGKLTSVGLSYTSAAQMTPKVNSQFWLEARDKPGLLIAMMRSLAGNAHISFEGDFADIDFSCCQRGSPEETSVLRRNTIYPRQDFVVLPLELGTVRPILDQVLPQGRAVHAITHVQIEKAGRLEFGAYDNFHPECIVVGPAVPRDTLDQLLSNGVLRAVHPASRGGGS